MPYQETIVPAPLLKKFTTVDKYITDALLPHDPALEATLEKNRASDLDAIDVAPNQGQFLYQLAKLANSKRILEVGTLGGYSAIWFAKAVGAGGKVITLEIDPRHAEIARSNIANAGFKDVVEVKVGPALQTLAQLSTQKVEGENFDFVFIDADKENNVGYFQYALEFSRMGTVIVVDNVARRGRLADFDCVEPSVVGTRNLFEVLKGEGRIEATAVQTVGSKGWDGFLMATVVA